MKEQQKKLDKAFGNYNDNNNMNDIFALKKEAKRNGFNSITEYIKYLRQSL